MGARKRKKPQPWHLRAMGPCTDVWIVRDPITVDEIADDCVSQETLSSLAKNGTWWWNESTGYPKFYLTKAPAMRSARRRVAAGRLADEAESEQWAARLGEKTS